MQEAEERIRRAIVNPVAPGLRARVFELGDMLFQSIRMQLSVVAAQGDRRRPRGHARHDRRAAQQPPVAQTRFAEIRKMADENDRLDEIVSIVHWTDPGPGGFYDDLGNVMRQPHLVRGVGFRRIPGFTRRRAFGS